MTVKDWVIDKGKKTGNTLDGLAKVGTLMGGLFVGLQGPAFIQDYIQRYGGHSDQSKMTLADCLKLRDNVVPDQVCRAVHSPRVEYLTKGYNSLISAEGAYGRAKAFVTNFDYNIAKGTLENFEWSAPISKESVPYAIGGPLVGLGIYVAGKGLARKTVKLGWNLAKKGWKGAKWTGRELKTMYAPKNFIASFRRNTPTRNP